PRCWSRCVCGLQAPWPGGRAVPAGTFPSAQPQSCSARPGLLTAPDVVSYWQKVFEKNGIPEAQESSEYIVSFVLGAKTFQSLDSEKLRDLISLVVEESRKCEAKNSAFSVAVPPPVILEIGCGSGAIALSLLCKIPQSRVLAVDKEEAAVDLTRENVHRYEHTYHLFPVNCSAKHLLPWGPMDFIVSNPPYVFHEDMASLDAEILRYEDLDALDGGDDGMRVIRTILTLAPPLLKDSGVFLEVDPRHPDMVEDWLHAHPDLLLTLRAVHKDFCGKPRFLHIQKQSR
uniref:HemK methyltransferase family member 1 n=1 Tax=Pavo cristatus TaxID=9049 RepID=A0A8C9LCP3_PAVCR